MIKLVCFVRRKPGMDPEEFHRYWREVHGPLIASTKSGSHVLRYEQNHRPLSDYRPHGGGAVADDDGFDGVTIQWYESIESFYASIAEPDYAEIDADIKKFLDVDRLTWLLTEDHEVVFDRLS